MDLKDLTIEKLRGTKVAVHCKTQEEWDEVSRICGYVWTICNFKDEDDMCISLKHKWSSEKKWFELTNFTIIPAADFIAANRKEVVTELTFDRNNIHPGVQFKYTDSGFLSIQTGVDGVYLSKPQALQLIQFLNQLP